MLRVKAQPWAWLKRLDGTGLIFVLMAACFCMAYVIVGVCLVVSKLLMLVTGCP